MNRDALGDLLATSSLQQRKPFSSATRLDWYAPPEISQVLSFNEHKRAVYTLVLPVFNQESIIADFIKSHDLHASLPYNFIAILDCCTDQSEAALQSALETLNSSNLVQAAMITTSVPFFETACDNIGFLCSETDYIIETQPDLFIATRGYDRRLLSVLSNDKVSCVSGRCGHSFGELVKPPKWKKILGIDPTPKNSRVGLLGSRIEKDGLSVDDTQMTAYFCETVNRGPIAFRRADLVKSDYLDQESFYLGNDDHDWNLRQWMSAGRLPAYVPIKISSKLEWGSTRKSRDPLNERVFQGLKHRPDHSTLQSFMPSYKPFCKVTPFTFGDFSG